MDIKIRRLEREDFAKGFFESLSNLFEVGLTIEQAEEIFDNISSNPFYHFFVAEIDNEIVGVTTLLVEQKFLLKGAQFGHIEDVAVRKGFERKGVGKLLIGAAIAKANQEGCYTVRLDCNDDNVPFYQKCGFELKEHMMQLEKEESVCSTNRWSCLG